MEIPYKNILISVIDLIENQAREIRELQSTIVRLRAEKRDSYMKYKNHS